jgi:hypothetical protein
MQILPYDYNRGTRLYYKYTYAAPAPDYTGTWDSGWLAYGTVPLKNNQGISDNGVEVSEWWIRSYAKSTVQTTRQYGSSVDARPSGGAKSPGAVSLPGDENWHDTSYTGGNTVGVKRNVSFNIYKDYTGTSGTYNETHNNTFTASLNLTVSYNAIISIVVNGSSTTSASSTSPTAARANGQASGTIQVSAQVANWGSNATDWNSPSTKTVNNIPYTDTGDRYL